MLIRIATDTGSIPDGGGGADGLLLLDLAKRQLDGVVPSFELATSDSKSMGMLTHPTARRSPLDSKLDTSIEREELVFVVVLLPTTNHACGSDTSFPLPCT